MSRQSNANNEISSLPSPTPLSLVTRNSNASQLNVKTGSVIDHWKTKVIRKRTSKQDSTESTSMPKLTRMNSIDLDDDPSDSVVPNRKSSDASLFLAQVVEETKTTDVARSKPKMIRAVKSLSTAEQQSTVREKKHRQNTRRTGFQVRDQDFHTIFTELSSDERLVISYSCACRKDAFLHGRLFLAMHYLCFYAHLFKWEEHICLRYEDIVSVTREKSVKLVPNAIKIRTKSEQQYVFVSHLPRERIFISIFRLWQNALLKQPLDFQQLYATIHADESTGESEESIQLENSFDQSQDDTFSRSLPTPNRRSPVVHFDESSSSTSQLRPTSSLPSINDQQPYRESCSCSSHLAKVYADQTFTFNIDTLYEFIFGDNSFTQAFHRSQNLSDYKTGPWQLNPETNKRERLVTYKTVTHSIFGTNTLFCQEKQTFIVEKPHSMYVVNCDVHNEGMKYTDAFYVATRFCMIQRDAERCALKISAEVRYLKSVNGFIKSFIEKNCHTSIENGVKDQVRQLEAQQITHVTRSSATKPLKPARKEKKVVPEIEEESSLDSVTLSESYAAKTLTGRSILFDIGLVVGIFFILVHLYLCYKLYTIDRLVSSNANRCLHDCVDFPANP